MQNRVVLSMLLGVFVLGFTSYLPAVYADDDYTTSTEANCLAIPATTAWEPITSTCTLNDTWNMSNVDHLTVSFNTNFVISTTGSLTNEGEISISETSTFVNSGYLKNERESFMQIGNIFVNQEFATFDNFGRVTDASGTFTNFGTLNTSGGIFIISSLTNENTIQNTATLTASDFFDNTSNGFIYNFGSLNFQGPSTNSGYIENSGSIDVVGLFTNEFGATVFNFSTITLDPGGSMINAGHIESDSGAFIELDEKLENLSTGTFDNYGELYLEKFGQIINSGSVINHDSGDPNSRDGVITMASAPPDFSRIENNNIFQNNDTLLNQCGVIFPQGSISGNPPVDQCYGFVLITEPADDSIWNELDVITFTATAIDRDNYGIDTDLSEFSMWKSNGDTYGPASSIDVQFTPHPHKKMTVTAHNATGPLLDGDGKKIKAEVVIKIEIIDGDGDGFSPISSNDCNDADAAINPDAEEVFDGVDNNCIDGIDEGFTDLDDDGFAAEIDDCDDSNNLINPNGTEVLDGVDNNCDGNVDEGFIDEDGDFFTPLGGDCNDADAAINPDAEEVLDGVDNNCDGVVDEGFDGDGDGYNPTPYGLDCNDADAAINPDAEEVFDGVDNNCDGLVDEGYIDEDGDLFTPMGGDCNDNDITINPDAEEVLDGVDNNCDGVVDEGFDGDGDGYNPTPYGLDCNDADAAINPDAEEVFDGVDNNCNGLVDEIFTDEDGDGFAVEIDDCDDTDSLINPNAEEVLDFKDNNCNGLVDEGFDEDGDGFNSDLDCDDNDPLTYPGALEIPDGKDQDCDTDIDNLQNEFAIPEFQENLDDKTVRDFDRMSDKLSYENSKLVSENDKFDMAINRYETKAAEAEAEGNLEKAAKYQAKADELKVEKASNESLIQINEKQILVIDMSTGKIPVDYYQTIIYKYDNLDDKTINAIVHDIADNLKTIEKLEKKAAKYDEKAAAALEGNPEKAAKYQAKADKRTEKAEKYQAKADAATDDGKTKKAARYQAMADKQTAKAEKYQAKADLVLEGDTEKAEKYQAKAIQLREEIAVYEELNHVLKYSITFTIDMLENIGHNDKDDDHNEKKWDKYWNKSFYKQHRD